MQKQVEKKSKKGEPVNIEQLFKDLTSIVARLEQNDCSLEESLQLYEEGVKLANSAHQAISLAERRIEILAKSTDGNPNLVEFDYSEESSEHAAR